MLGLDYSTGPPTGAQIRAAGYDFVVRYLDNGIPGRVNLSVHEVMDMQANGVQIALVWESSAQRATAGATAGTADGAAAAVAARALGLDGWPIYFAVDFDIPDYAPASTDPLAKLGPVGAYFQGVRSALALPRIGVYGGYWAVSRALNAGLAALAWQTAAWSGGNVDTRAALFQNLAGVTVGGVGCDVNEQRASYFGQSAPAGPAQTGDDDMAPNPVLYAAAAVASVNGGVALYPNGVWRDEFGVYTPLASAAERSDLVTAFPAAVTGPQGTGVWLEQATLDGLVKSSKAAKTVTIGGTLSVSGVPASSVTALIPNHWVAKDNGDGTTTVSGSTV